MEKTFNSLYTNMCDNLKFTPEYSRKKVNCFWLLKENQTSEKHLIKKFLLRAFKRPLPVFQFSCQNSLLKTSNIKSFNTHWCLFGGAHTKWKFWNTSRIFFWNMPIYYISIRNWSGCSIVVHFGGFSQRRFWRSASRIKKGKAFDKPYRK